MSIETILKQQINQVQKCIDMLSVPQSKMKEITNYANKALYLETKSQKQIQTVSDSFHTLLCNLIIRKKELEKDLFMAVSKRSPLLACHSSHNSNF